MKKQGHKVDSFRSDSFQVSASSPGASHRPVVGNKESSGDSRTAWPAYRLVVVGASLGGTRAVSYLFSTLPANFSLPIAVVVHRGADLGVRLRDMLQSQTALPVLEVEDKMAIEPGQVYLAPANYHLLVGKTEFSLSTEAPVVSARPSIDVLFESASAAYGRATIALVLTGASPDGAQGTASIRQRGGYVIVQDPADAESATMPLAAIATASPNAVLPLKEIPECLSKLAQLKYQGTS